MARPMGGAMGFTLNWGLPTMKTSVLSALIGAGCFLMANVDPASAQATGTWVSGLGDDVNPCSRTSPCKTFAGAINKTAAAGEIRCLDPGGFGNVTITKSITIDCFGTLGAILVPAGSSGIIINAPGIIVILRHIDINGANTGLSGIRFMQGEALIVEHTSVPHLTDDSHVAANQSVCGHETR
jgi:hypothetical protein